MTDEDDIEYDQDLEAFEYLNEAFEREEIIATELEEIEEDPSLVSNKYEGVNGAKTVDFETLSPSALLKRKAKTSNSPTYKKAELNIDDFFELDGTDTGIEDSFSNVFMDPASVRYTPHARDLFPLPATPPADSLPRVENISRKTRSIKETPRKGDKRRRHGNKAGGVPPLDLRRNGLHRQKQEPQVGGKEHTRRRKLDLRKRREVELAVAKVCVGILMTWNDRGALP